MVRIKLGYHEYNNIISIENLLSAWREFLKGKRNKKDVQDFQYNLFDNINSLHINLKNKTYKHGDYYSFNISDPKPRNIHKASVRDRLLHHAIYRVLYLFFDRRFINDSYSCRKYKGTHRAIERFKHLAYLESSRHSKTIFILKCDVRKFFASIDHKILMDILATHISDVDTLWLIKNIIGSFQTRPGKGLPLGNLTSQLLVNVYMNEFDRFVKHKIKARRYIRYADDFVIISRDREFLMKTIPAIQKFLFNILKLGLHPNKVSIGTLVAGVDFLGWVHFPDHRVLRTTTKKRMMKALKNKPKPEVVQSYLGLLKHGNTNKLIKIIEATTTL